LPRHSKIVLDTVTISNFVNVDELAVLCEFYGNRLYITESVIIELKKANIDLQAWIDDGRIKKAVFEYDIGTQSLMPETLADGEVSCIVYAMKTEAAVATDDYRARQTVIALCGQEKLTGTVGILDEMVKSGTLSAKSARALLRSMIDQGFWFKGEPPF